jgi:hypothetical protein
VEGAGKGHTDAFAPVVIKDAVRGQTGNVRVLEADANQLTGAWA